MNMNEFQKKQREIEFERGAEDGKFEFMLRRGNYSRMKVKITMWDGNFGWEWELLGVWKFQRNVRFSSFEDSG
jgi:hypothetical protein